MNGTERLDFDIEDPGDDDPDACGLRRRQGDRAVIHRGDRRLLERCEHVGDADGERLDVAAPEREHEEERRQEARRKTTSIRLDEKRDDGRESRQHLRPFYITAVNDD